MMTEEQIYEIWAPAGRPWSAWAKPVLFTQVHRPVVASPPSTPQELWDNAADLARERLALILDVPGERAVHAGVQLASAGYQPVPLFNTSYSQLAVVPVGAILAELARGAEVLAATNIPDNAPPAFLLDSRRMQERGRAQPGRYDNRWLVFPQDFPSADHLRSRDVRGAVLVQDESRRPPDDLAHVLLRWQEDGLPLLSAAASPGSLVPEILRVEKPPRYRALWQHWLAVLGLRRNSAGGFGSMVPTPSQGGGFG